jgi:hypothetical protein
LLGVKAFLLIVVGSRQPTSAAVRLGPAGPAVIEVHSKLEETADAGARRHHLAEAFIQDRNALLQEASPGLRREALRRWRERRFHDPAIEVQLVDVDQQSVDHRVRLDPLVADRRVDSDVGGRTALRLEDIPKQPAAVVEVLVDQRLRHQIFARLVAPDEDPPVVVEAQVVTSGRSPGEKDHVRERGRHRPVQVGGVLAQRLDGSSDPTAQAHAGEGPPG